MSSSRSVITVIAALTMTLGCTGPSPSAPVSPTIPVTASTGPTGPASPSGGQSPGVEVRNHLLSTLDYVAEVAADLADAGDAAAAANALEPLGGVLDDEVEWYAGHVSPGMGGPIGSYGADIASTRAAVRALEAAGPAASDQLVAAARAALADLLALRPALEALPSR